MLFLLKFFVVYGHALCEVMQSELNFPSFVSADCGVKLGLIACLRGIGLLF